MNWEKIKGGDFFFFEFESKEEMEGNKQLIIK